jgi:hypothetical protein
MPTLRQKPAEVQHRQALLALIADKRQRQRASAAEGFDGRSVQAASGQAALTTPRRAVTAGDSDSDEEDEEEDPLLKDSLDDSDCEAVVDLEDEVDSPENRPPPPPNVPAASETAAAATKPQPGLSRLKRNTAAIPASGAASKASGRMGGGSEQLQQRGTRNGGAGGASSVDDLLARVQQLRVQQRGGSTQQAAADSQHVLQQAAACELPDSGSDSGEEEDEAGANTSTGSGRGSDTEEVSDSSPCSEATHDQRKQPAWEPMASLTGRSITGGTGSSLGGGGSSSGSHNATSSTTNIAIAPGVAPAEGSLVLGDRQQYVLPPPIHHKLYPHQVLVAPEVTVAANIGLVSCCDS